MRKAISRFAAALLGILAIPGIALAQEAQREPIGGACRPWQMMHDWGMGWGWGGMFLGPLFMIVWLGILVVLVVLLVRWLGGGNFGINPAPRTARDILDERYARGEIEHDEYEQRRKALEG